MFQMPEISMNVLLSILSYSFCSGTMLIINKALMGFVPPAQLATLQFLFAGVIVSILGKFNFIKLTPLEKANVVPYAKYASIFLLCVYSNMKTLQSSNVDTVIVFRSSTPIVVCLADTVLMGRMAPSNRSKFAMGCMSLGAFFYVLTDAAFKLGKSGNLGIWWWLMLFVVPTC